MLSHTDSEMAGVDAENFPTFLLVFTSFVTSVVSDKMPQLLDVFAVISQLFNLLFNQWITSNKNVIYTSLFCDFPSL